MSRKREKLITFARFGNESEALEMQTELESRNIKSVIMGNGLWTSFPNNRPKVSEIIVQIFEKDLDDAKQVLVEQNQQGNE
jgi:hypothetical protein